MSWSSIVTRTSLCGLLVACLCLEVSVAWAAGATHTRDFHLSPSPRIFSSHELVFLQKFKGWFKRHHLKAPAYDVGLREASWLLSTRMSKFRGRKLNHRVVRAALWLGGRTDSRIRIFGHGYKKPKALWRALFRSLSKTLAGQRPNVFGFAIVGGKTKVCILLLSRRGAALAPLRRWHYVGDTLTIRGRRLAQFKRPSVVLGMAGGRVVRPKVKLLKGGLFIAKWRIDRPGEIRVQVLVSDDEGPWLSAQCNIPTMTIAHSPQRVTGRLWQQHRSLLTAAPMKVVWFSKGNKGAKAPTPRNWTPKAATAALLRMVNALRLRHKLKKLRLHGRLTGVALLHAKDMVRHNFFAHTSPQKGSFRERFQRLGWKVKLARENIVAARTPAEAFRLLFRSPVHRANLFLRSAIYTGIGAAKNRKGVLFFAQVFVTPLQ